MTLNSSVVGSRATAVLFPRRIETTEVGMKGDGQMARAYGRHDAMRIWDASGELSGEGSSTHAQPIPPFSVPHVTAQLRKHSELESKGCVSLERAISSKMLR